MDNVIAIIMGGGRGARLAPLTTLRSKPAVPIGGQYRLIDIPISNCLHAEIRTIYVLTQFNSVSLHRHIQQTYRFDSFSAGGVELLAAEQTQEHTDWYQGTADAVRKQIRRFSDAPDDLILVLSGDQLYRMDYRQLIACHRQNDAEITLAVQPVTGQEARRFGIVKADRSGRIVRFHEKPQHDKDLADLRKPSMGSDDLADRYLASMGIYVFRADVLHAVLLSNDHEDFGRHIIPAAIASHRVYAFEFFGYWEDIGTIRSFYEANLALTDPLPKFDLHSPPPIYTRPRFLPGVKLDRCQTDRVIIGAGSIIVDTEIVRSVIGIRSRIGPHVTIRDSIVMGADYYESEAVREKNRAQGIPHVGIGAGSVIEHAIIDKNARIGENVRITNAAGLREAEGEHCVIRDGIVVVPKNAIIPPETVI
jgi:glucose-1-phosphate adenylyltransferase